MSAPEAVCGCEESQRHRAAGAALRELVQLLAGALVSYRADAGPSDAQFHELIALSVLATEATA